MENQEAKRIVQSREQQMATSLIAALMADFPQFEEWWEKLGREERAEFLELVVHELVNIQNIPF